MISIHKKGKTGQKQSVTYVKSYVGKLMERLMNTRHTNLSSFFHPTFAASFGRDTKSWWSLLYGVYASVNKKSHAGGQCVTMCSSILSISS